MRRRWPALLSAVLALPIAVVTIAGTLHWLDRPFPGFFTMGNAVVPTVGLRQWPGLGGGVPFHARVLAVDDTPITSNAELDEYVGSRPVGTTFRYTLQKDGETFTRSVPSMRFGPSDYALTVGLLAAFGVISIGSGVIVALLQPRRPAAIAFLLMQLLVGLYALTGTALYHPRLQWLSRFHFVMQAAFPAGFIHLGLTFPIERPFVRRRPVWIALPYAIGAILSAWILVDFYAAAPRTTPLYATYLYAAASIVVMIGLLLRAYWENAAPQVRPQLRVVLPCLAVGTVFGLYGYLDNARGGGTFPINFVAITPLAFYLAIGYAIARHDLFDVDALLKRTLVYVTLTLGITAAYAVAVAVVGRFVSTPASASPLFNVAFVVLIASLFEPLRTRVQRFIDTAFFRHRPDYQRTVREVSADLTSHLDLDEILTRVGQAVVDGFQLHSMALLLWLEDGTRLWRYRAVDRRMAEVQATALTSLRTFLGRHGPHPWQLPADDDVVAGPTSRELAGLQDDLGLLGAVLVLPLTVGGKVIGAFALGPKRSWQAFSTTDLALLETLGAQSAIAIHNAVSYQALATLNAQLESRVRARTAALETSHAELDRAYQHLKSAQAQLLQSEKLASLGQLVAGVAHEINNPISFIVGNMEPLGDQLTALSTLAERHRDDALRDAAERVRRIFEIVARGAERTAGIVNDLRIFSRAGDALWHPTDVHDGLEVTLRLLKPKWGSRIAIHRDFAALPLVPAAPGQLNQVFMNLLANACDAIAAEGNIWISTTVDQQAVRIAIRDDGCGIAAEHLGHLFEPFFTTKAQGKGTGLGLAISYGIVTQHRGAIEVRSDVGKGTEFVITLPLTAGA